MGDGGISKQVARLVGGLIGCALRALVVSYVVFSVAKAVLL